MKAEATYKAGDQVTIRSWQDMIDEFGNSGLIIINGIHFTGGMSNLCETTFRVHSSIWNDNYEMHLYRLSDIGGSMKNWWFIEEMFQHVSNINLGLIPDRSFKEELL